MLKTRSPMWAPILAMAALALAASSQGCATLARLTDSPRSYEAWRTTRLAPTYGEKVHASYLFLKNYPSSEHVPEVRAFFDDAEAKLYRDLGKTPLGARTYLELIPNGPHDQQVRVYLNRIEREEEAARMRAREAPEAARVKAKADREAAVQYLEGTVRDAVRITSWTNTVDALRYNDRPFADRFFQPPKPSCSADVCVQETTMAFPIADEERAWQIEVWLVLRAGLVSGVTIRLPKRGFQHYVEAATDKLPARPETALADALAFAKNRLEKIIRESSKCETVDSPEARLLRCPAVNPIQGQVEIRVASEATGDDVVTITRRAVESALP